MEQQQFNPEKERLKEHYNGNKPWLTFGPYLTERQWGTVREDYSKNGDAWNHITHHMAKSYAYKWGEEGIAGISDHHQNLCFSFAFWNQKDPIIKERFFGLNGKEGNHGEDVKEIYYYLDSSPTHSYMKMLYKYPYNTFPYDQLLKENKKRNRKQPEFELIETGIFDNNEYFDIFIEYAKASDNDILIKITACNRGNKTAPLHILPSLWFRNIWNLDEITKKPIIKESNHGNYVLTHPNFSDFHFHSQEKHEALFCENETNTELLFNKPNATDFVKDGINEYLVNQNKDAVNPNKFGTKLALNIETEIEADSCKTFCFRLENSGKQNPFHDFESIFHQRIYENNVFYDSLQKNVHDEDEKNIQRQAYAGMLWTKQFYYFDIQKWLENDEIEESVKDARNKGRNKDWQHMHNEDIISMPDKWEYPWYAAWDTAFHCIPLAKLDVHFTKNQLLLLTKEWYMHPNGQLPAYEWSFGDVNPPVHAWATLEVFLWDKKENNNTDYKFLESVFHKLLLNFTWWVNRKDKQGNNIFQGGFLGLDNIGVFDRSKRLPTGGYLEQTDGTAWMATYALNMMRISLELCKHNPVYQDMANKFFEHFLYIASALANLGGEKDGFWDEEDQFFYDVLRTQDNQSISLKVRSMVGLTPLFAVEVLNDQLLNSAPEFKERLKWFLNKHADLAALVSRWEEKGIGEQRLLSLLRGHRMKKLLKRMLDETEFLSEFGIRALSKHHKENPYIYKAKNKEFRVDYSPAESTTNMFGGNSNWRGPIWFPVNFMLIHSLKKFYEYYGPEFIVEYPTNSGEFLNLNEIANKLSQRLVKIFKTNNHGIRPVYGHYSKFQNDPYFNQYVHFHEYFHGDNGLGLGASHQTGWTGLVAELIGNQ